MNEIYISEHWVFEQDEIYHEHGRGVVGVRGRGRYKALRWLDGFNCSNCGERAPQPVNDAGLLAGVRGRPYVNVDAFLGLLKVAEERILELEEKCKKISS